MMVAFVLRLSILSAVLIDCVCVCVRVHAHVYLHIYARERESMPLRGSISLTKSARDHMQTVWYVKWMSQNLHGVPSTL